MVKEDEEVDDQASKVIMENIEMLQNVLNKALKIHSKSCLINHQGNLWQTKNKFLKKAKVKHCNISNSETFCCLNCSFFPK